MDQITHVEMILIILSVESSSKQYEDTNTYV